MPETVVTFTDVLKNLPRLPADLIFCTGPRLTSPGWRWAPATFLAQPRSIYIRDEEEGKISSLGYLLRKCGIRLAAPLDFIAVNHDTDLPVIYTVRNGAQELVSFFAPHAGHAALIHISDGGLRKRMVRGYPNSDF